MCVCVGLRQEWRGGGGLVCHGYSHRVASHLCPLFAQGAFAQVLLAGCQDEVLQLTHLARSCACLATNTNTVRTHTHTHEERMAPATTTTTTSGHLKITLTEPSLP